MSNDKRQREIRFFIVQILIIALTFVIVALRLLCRFFISNNPGWDDYVIIVAMVDSTNPYGPLINDIDTRIRSWRYFRQL